RCAKKFFIVLIGRACAKRTAPPANKQSSPPAARPLHACAAGKTSLARGAQAWFLHRHRKRPMSQPKTLVIIPTYNERENLPAIADALMKLPVRVEMLVVDDNSPDGTGQLADD